MPCIIGSFGLVYNLGHMAVITGRPEMPYIAICYWAVNGSLTRFKVAIFVINRHIPKKAPGRLY